MTDVTVYLSGVAASASVGSVSLLTRSNLAKEMLSTAVAAAKCVYEITVSDPHFLNPKSASHQIQRSTVAIVMATTALEAAVNETITDIVDNRQGMSAELLAKWEKLRAGKFGNVLGKMKDAAVLHDSASTFDASAAPYQGLHFLLQFRNSLIHFKPARSDKTQVHDCELAQQIEQIVGRSTPYQGEANFPIGYLHYGAAKWAISTVRSASGAFSPLVGEHDRFADLSSDFTLP